MKRILLTLLLAVASLAHGQEWLTDYDAALKLAKKQNRPVLMDFTGSDWCPPCMMLNRAVFQSKDFQTYAAEHLVLLKVDFPQRNPLPPAQTERNRALAVRYGVIQNSTLVVPSIILLHPDGSTAGKMDDLSYRPKSFIASLEKILKK